MTIKSVRFPSPVAVVKGEVQCEWKPGERGVKDIDMNNACSIFFEMQNGDERVVVAPPGTVIERRNPAEDPPVICHVCGVDFQLHAHGKCPPKKVEAVANGPGSSPPSADPPPARPIPKSGRVQR